MKGRPPKTLEQRAADGDTRKLGRKKFAKAQDNGIAIERGFPPCPDYLGADAKEAWAYWAPQLKASGIDYAVSAPALEAACIQVGRMRECERQIAEEGLFVDIVKIVDGEPLVVGKRKHPAEQMARQAAIVLKGLMVEFGMTAVSRARVANGEQAKGLPHRGAEEALRTIRENMAKPRKLNFIPVQ